MSRPLSSLSALASGLDHPEGVCWAPDGKVYATGEAGQVYRVDPAATTFAQVGSTGGFGLGIAADAQSNLYICDMGVKAVVRVAADGTSSTYSRGDGGEPLTVPNFPVFDAQGNLYVSNSANWGSKNGSIQRIAPGGTGEVWSRAAAGYTNGMALSPDGKYLYVVESIPPLVSRIAIGGDGRAGAYEVVVELPNTVPDGIAFDSEGGLWIACYAPDRVYRLAPDGTLETAFDDWQRMALNAPTNLAFAGDKLDSLVVASLGGYSLMRTDVGVTGAPLNYPSLSP
jgi:gluconolactonase